MPNEFWEIVRADELNVGDVAAFGSVDGIRRFVPSYVEIEADCVRVTAAETEDKIEMEYAFLRDEPVLCRYTGHHPDVLMRAMRLMHFALYDEKTHVPMAGDPQNYIRQAEAEIAEERES